MSPSSLVPELQQAEDARVAGDHKKVQEALKNVPYYSVEELGQLPAEDLQKFMMALRIRVVDLSREFSEGLLAFLAVPYLSQVKALLDYYYAAPVIREAATMMKFDPTNPSAEYLMAVEQWRDIAKYYIYLAGLTGNQELLQIAVDILDRATELGEPTSSAVTLARFERAVAQVGLQQEVDVTELEADWRTIVGLSVKAGGHDRAAKVSWQMARVAKRLSLSDLAAEAKKTCQEHANFLPGGYIKYAAGQLWKEIVTTSTKRLTHFSGSTDLELAPQTINA